MRVYIHTQTQTRSHTHINRPRTPVRQWAVHSQPELRPTVTKVHAYTHTHTHISTPHTCTSVGCTFTTRATAGPRATVNSSLDTVKPPMVKRNRVPEAARSICRSVNEANPFSIEICFMGFCVYMCVCMYMYMLACDP